MAFSVDQALQAAIVAHKAGRLQEAERLYRSILQVQPRHADANHNLGVLALSVHRTALSLPLFKTALQANPKQAQYWVSYIDALIKAGETDQARAVLLEGQKFGLKGDVIDGLASQLRPLPDGAAVHFKLANSQVMQGRLAEAEASYRRTIALEPGHARAHANLGATLKNMGRLAEAQACYRQAITLKPDHAEAHSNLAVVLLEQGHLASAEAACRQAITLKPEHANAHANLGVILMGLGRLAEAQACCRQAIALEPGHAGAHDNLAVILVELGRLEEAQACCRQAIALQPGNSTAHNNLAVTLIELGRFEEAAACCRQAMALEPGYAEAHSNLLFSMNYVPGLPVEASLQEARRYGQAVSAQASGRHVSWRCSAAPQCLRIGFVSGDLRNHPVGYFLQGLLSKIDRSRFELIAYSTTPKEDELTQRIKPQFHRWQSLCALSDDAAARQIHGDGVHVLIDLAGHTAHNRLPVFALKPAPVQVAWLGYFATTGVEAIDYLLGDPHVTPIDEEHHFTERVWRLPETYFCFAPPALDIAVGSLPALSNGHVTFACFNNLSKIGDAVTALWADVLHAVSGAKLFLKAKQLADRRVADNLIERFGALGITPERLIIEGPSDRIDYLLAHRRVDIALDPFPYPGGATSAEALWMGVPVITRRGDRFVGHNGETIAHNAGQSDWIAHDAQDYLRKAQFFASDLQALAATRSALRQRVLASPLFDAARFARHFEQALTGMWTASRTLRPHRGR